MNANIKKKFDHYNISGDLDSWEKSEFLRLSPA